MLVMKVEILSSLKESEKTIMKTKFLLIILLLFSVCLTAQNVKAKVAVMLKSKDQILRLKSSDRVKVGDEIRIFVQPETDCFVYVLFSDSKETNLLNYRSSSYKLKKDSKLTLPSNSEFYQFDDKSNKSTLVIYCSQNQIYEIENAFKDIACIENKKWKETEILLAKNNKINLNTKSDKPISIAGNVRSLNDDFQNKLQLFSDDKVIIKKFDIEIKK